MPLEASAFLRGLVRRAGPRGLRDPAEDVRAATARAVRLVMRRFLSQEARANGGGGEILVHGFQRLGKGVGGSGTGSGAGRSSGGIGGGIDGGEVFDVVWEALEGLDQDSACVEVRVPWDVRCVFEVPKGCVLLAARSWPGDCLCAFGAQPAVGASFHVAERLFAAGCGFRLFRRGA